MASCVTPIRYGDRRTAHAARSRTVNLLSALVMDCMAISIVTYAKVLEAIYSGHEPARHEAMFQRLLRGVELLGVS